MSSKAKNVDAMCSRAWLTELSNSFLIHVRRGWDITQLIPEKKEPARWERRSIPTMTQSRPIEKQDTECQCTRVVQINLVSVRQLSINMWSALSLLPSWVEPARKMCESGYSHQPIVGKGQSVRCPHFVLMKRGDWLQSVFPSTAKIVHHS